MQIKDIMDLDFLVRLDEESGSKEQITERDRHIYRQLDSGRGWDDKALLLAWLESRRALFSRGARVRQTPSLAVRGPGAPQGQDVETMLPGTLFAALYRWAAWGISLAGLVMGILMAYSFLAYHGSQPINVTVFTAFFILFQALVSLAALGVMVIKLWRPGGIGLSFFQGLMSHMVFRRLPGLLARAGSLPGVRQAAGLARTVEQVKNQVYNPVFFWPFFILSSLFALGFSTGALGGTLFRVLVTDLAFGWQSTLLDSPAQVHGLVSWLALPWSWCMPDAVPDLVQIQGSRILLKEGLLGLATKDLVSWWPFLTMGILVYGMGLRLVVIFGAVAAQKRVLAGLDFSQPRYRRLLARMTGPAMAVDIARIQGTRAVDRAPLPDPQKPDPQKPDPQKPEPQKTDARKPGLPETDAGRPRVSRPVTEPVTEPGPLAPKPRDAGNFDREAADSHRPDMLGDQHTALVLASARVYPGKALETIGKLVADQFGIRIGTTVRVGFDMSEDQDALASHAGPEGPGPHGPVIVFYEVWQPPIRGLLYYFVQLKTQVFPDRPLWIVLTQTPGEKRPGVDADDLDFRIWEKAVAQLKDPDIILERLVP